MCGLAGIISRKRRPFDYGTFCCLGIANDARGGDSCGIFIDGKYEYGIKETKYFSNFFIDNDLLNSITTSQIALLHCRKASVGVIDEKRAQPVIIKNNDKIEFVLMHNGTIHNYKELANKYIPDIDITGLTDSQVMANIFYRKGYDCLSEYNGGAVFIIVDYRVGPFPEVLLFKGKSKKYTTSKEEEDERPLYFCIDNENEELVFSSIMYQLFALRNHVTIFEAPANTLVRFSGKNINLVKKVDRSKCTEGKLLTNIYDSVYWGNDYYDYKNKHISYYLGVSYLDNTYSIKGKKANGCVFINEWGKISNSKTNECKFEIWFYDGVALKNRKCYQFLIAMKRLSKLSDVDFHLIFENVIRYLSLDEIYNLNGSWVHAITPDSSIKYSGESQMLGVSTRYSYTDGERIPGYKSMTSKDNMNILFNGKYDIDFKNIRKKCLYLMNLNKD